MARIAGVDLPRNKRIDIGLSYLYGIGRPVASQILSRTSIDPSRRIKDLTEAEVAILRDIVEKEYRVEGDLRREVQLNIKRLIEIGSYRGLRHKRNLPTRGQRTRTNARTRKGIKRLWLGATASRRKEEVARKYGTTSSINSRATQADKPAPRAQERRVWAGAHQRELQQYNHHRHRQDGRHHLLGHRRRSGLSRQPQKHAVCGPHRSAKRLPAGRGKRLARGGCVCERPRPWPRERSARLARLWHSR